MSEEVEVNGSAAVESGEEEFEADYVGETAGEDIRKEGKGVVGGAVTTEDTRAQLDEDPTEDQVTEIEEDSSQAQPAIGEEDLRDIPEEIEIPEDTVVPAVPPVKESKPEPADEPNPEEPAAASADAAGGAGLDEKAEEVAIEHFPNTEEPVSEPQADDSEKNVEAPASEPSEVANGPATEKEAKEPEPEKEPVPEPEPEPVEEEVPVVSEPVTEPESEPVSVPEKAVEETSTPETEPVSEKAAEPEPEPEKAPEPEPEKAPEPEPEKVPEPATVEVQKEEPQPEPEKELSPKKEPSPKKEASPEKEKTPERKPRKISRKEKAANLPEPEPEAVAEPEVAQPEPEPVAEEPEKEEEIAVQYYSETKAEEGAEEEVPVPEEEEQEIEEPIIEAVEAPVLGDKTSSKEASPEPLMEKTYRPPAARVPPGTHYSSIEPESDYSPKSAYVPYGPSVISPSRKLQRDISHLDSIRHGPRTTSSSYLSRFDNVVSTGEFSKNLWATESLAERVLERSRERSRTRRASRSLSRASSGREGSVPRFGSYTLSKSRSMSLPPSMTLTPSAPRAPYRSTSHTALFEYIDRKESEIAPMRNQTRYERRLGLHHDEPITTGILLPQPIRYSRLPIMNRAYYQEPNVDSYVYRMHRPAEAVLSSPFTPPFTAPVTARHDYYSPSSYRESRPQSSYYTARERPYTSHYTKPISHFGEFVQTSYPSSYSSYSSNNARRSYRDYDRSMLHKDVGDITRRIDSMNWASTALSNTSGGRHLESALRQRSSYAVTAPIHHSRHRSYYSSFY